MIPKKILFCSDFSENSRGAERCAADFAKAFNSDLAVLHVIDFWAGIPAVYRKGVMVPVLEVTRQIQESVDARLEELVERCRGCSGEVKAYSRMGIPTKEILKLAAEESVDLIVLGTHARAGVERAMLGSVAAAVTRAARCPVLIVRSA